MDFDKTSSVIDQLQDAQQSQIADMFRSAEGTWAEDGPQYKFNSSQTGAGGGRALFPILLNEFPLQGDRVIKPFAEGLNGGVALTVDG